MINRVPYMECDPVYIGEAPRNLEERLREHQRHVEKKDPKGHEIAEHVMKTGHTIAWDKVQVIDMLLVFHSPRPFGPRRTNFSSPSLGFQDIG